MTETESRTNRDRGESKTETESRTDRDRGESKTETEESQGQTEESPRQRRVNDKDR